MSGQAGTQLALVVGFAAIAITIARVAGVGLAGALGRAAGRATVQLLAVGAVLTVVLDHEWLAAVFVAVMLTTATLTARGRIGVPGMVPEVVVAIAIPAGLAAAALLAAGAVPGSVIAAIATIGILIGGAMSATSLTGRALVRELNRDLPRIEARLCLGQRVREASGEAVRHAIVSGLVPALDQTRTVGLIALPGTFVGLVLGGAHPAEAARVQLLVLVGLLAVELSAAVLAAHAIVRHLTVSGAERLAPLRPGE
ncbi:MAG: ABC transporter permease [Solirubrobacteraceae bacterium]|nr:ABC transporter permease [Solirubrobacteraceae bacterium]